MNHKIPLCINVEVSIIGITFHTMYLIIVWVLISLMIIYLLKVSIVTFIAIIYLAILLILLKYIKLNGAYIDEFLLKVTFYFLRCRLWQKD